MLEINTIPAETKELTFTHSCKNGDLIQILVRVIRQKVKQSLHGIDCDPRCDYEKKYGKDDNEFSSQMTTSVL